MSNTSRLPQTTMFRIFIVLTIALLAGCGGGGGGGGGGATIGTGGLTAAEVELDGGTFVISNFDPDFGVLSLSSGTGIVSSPELSNNLTVTVIDAITTNPIPGIGLEYMAKDDKVLLRVVDSTGVYGRSINICDVSGGQTVFTISVDQRANTVTSYNTNLQRYFDAKYSKFADIHNRYIACRTSAFELARWLKFYYGGASGTGAMLNVATDAIPTLSPGLGDDWSVLTLNLTGLDTQTITDAILAALLNEAPFLFGGLISSGAESEGLEGQGIENSVTQDTLFYCRIHNIERLDRGGSWSPGDTGSVFHNNESRIEVDILAPDSDDRFENGVGNDTLINAQLLDFQLENGLILKPTDPDYYKIFLEQDELLDLRISFLGAHGDMSLRVFDPSDQEMFGVVSSTTNTERALIAVVPETGFYTFCIEYQSGWELQFYNVETNTIGGSGFGIIPTSLEIPLSSAGIGDNWPTNKVNSHNAVDVKVQIDFTPAELSVGDKIEVRVRDTGNPGTQISTIHTLLGGEVSGGSALVAVGNANSIPDGILLVEARFLDSLGSPVGVFMRAGSQFSDPDPLKDSLAPMTTNFVFDDDGSGKARLDATMTVTLSRSVNSTQFAAAFELLEMPSTTVTVSVSPINPSGGNASAFLITPSGNLSPNMTYAPSLDPMSLEDLCQNQFDQNQNPADGGDLWTTTFISTGGGGPTPSIDFASRTVGKGGDVIMLCGSNLDAVTDLAFDGFSFIGENFPDAEGGFWKFISASKIKLVLPEINNVKYSDDAVHEIHINAMASGIVIGYVQTTAPPLLPLTNVDLLMGAGDPMSLDHRNNSPVPLPGDVDALDGNAEPLDITSLIELGNSQVFICGMNNLMSYPVGLNGMMDSASAATLFEFDEVTADTGSFPATPVIHPNQSANVGYVAVNNFSVGDSNIFPITNVRSPGAMLGTPFDLSVDASDDDICKMEISPCGNFLGIVGEDGSGKARVWVITLNPTTGLPIGTGPFTGMVLSQGSINLGAFSLAFAPDAQSLYVAYGDDGGGTSFEGYIDYIDLSSGTPAAPVLAFASSGGTAMSPNCFDDIIIHPDGAVGYIINFFPNDIIKVSIAGSSVTFADSVILDDVNPSSLLLDHCNDLLFVATEGSVVVTIVDSGASMTVVDRFVPGVDIRQIAMSISVDVLNATTVSQSEYKVTAPCSLGSNIDPLMIPGFNPPGFVERGYVAQLDVHFAGTELDDGNRFVNDTNVPAGKFWVTVFDSATGVPSPNGGGWFTQTNGLLLGGYAGEVPGSMGYFNTASAGVTGRPGTFEFTKTDFAGPVGLTVVNEASVPSDARFALSVQSFDLVAGNNHWHLSPNSSCEDDSGEGIEFAFIKGLLAPGSTGVLWSNTNPVYFRADWEDDGLLITPEPSNPFGQNFYLAELRANVTNTVVFNVDNNGGGFAGQVTRELPRLHRDVCWDGRSGFPDYEPNMTLLSTPIIEQSPAVPYSIDFNLFNDLDESGASVFSNVNFRDPFPNSPFGVDSGLGGTAMVDSMNLTGTLQMTALDPGSPPGASNMDYEVFVTNNRDQESFTLVLNSMDIPTVTVNIFPMAAFISPVQGTVMTGTTLSISYTNPIFGAPSTHSGLGPAPAKGLFTFQRSSHCGDICWLLARGETTASATGSFNWPAHPTAFDTVFTFQEGELNVLQLEYSAIASTSSGVTVVGNSVAGLDEFTLDSETICGSRGSRVEIIRRDLGAVGSFYNPIGVAPVERESHVAIVEHATNGDRVVLIGGKTSIGIPTTQTFDWSIGDLSNNGTPPTGTSLAGSVGIQLDLGPGDQDTDYHVLGGLDALFAPQSADLLFRLPSTHDGMPMNPPTVYDLNVPRTAHASVPFWHENLGGAFNEHPHAFAVFGGATGMGDTVTPSQMIEIYMSKHLLTLQNGTQTEFGNIPATHITISGNTFVPRQNFATVLLSDYTENDNASPPAPSDIGIARILLFGGTQVNMTTMQTVLLDSVQLVTIDYRTAVDGSLSSTNDILVTVTDMPPMIRPRAFHTATPVWQQWNWPISNFLEFENLSAGDFAEGYNIFIAGGADYVDFNGIEGSCETEIYFVDVATLSNSTSNEGPPLNQRRFGHSTFNIDGTMIMVGGAWESNGGVADPFALTVSIVERYTLNGLNPWEGTMEALNFLGKGRLLHTATQVNTFGTLPNMHEILIVGGRDGRTRINETDSPGQTAIIFSPPGVPAKPN